MPTRPDVYERARAALDEIVDPCSAAAGLPVGIASLGLVKALVVTALDDGASVHVTLRVTGPNCVMAPVFIDEAERRLRSLEGVSEVTVAFDATPDWMPEDMDPAYRARREASLRASARR